MSKIKQWNCECVNQISAQLKEQSQGKHKLPLRDMMNFSECQCGNCHRFHKDRLPRAAKENPHGLD